MAAEPGLDARAYRDVVGRFATGVTVLTLRDGDEPAGMTANAFASVSLDPLLVLVCVDFHASMHERVRRATAFAVNLLAADQRPLSEHFAHRDLRAETGPMGDFGYHDGRTGSPILHGTLGWLECRMWQQYEGGDHTIVIGEVVDMHLAQPDGQPLVFFRGRYGSFREAE